MLILTRKCGESIIIGEDKDVKITVLGVRGDQVKLGFDAEISVVIHRDEIYRKIHAEKHTD